MAIAAAADLVLDTVLVKKYDGFGPRYTSYPTADRFHSGVTAEQYVDALHARNQERPTAPLSLYVHIPFCNTICYYCACNKVITKDHGRSAKYIKYVGREIEIVSGLVEGGPKVEQLHWGGGTPTFLARDEMSTLMGMLRGHFAFAPDAEISIEVDPRKVSADTIVFLGRLGFNRISVGIQDFDPAVQQAVNRIQTEAETMTVIDAARSNGFVSVNADLIYGLPRQTVAGFSATLDKVIAASPDRIALYSYAHVPHLFKPQRRIDVDALPAPETKLAILALAIEKLGAAGYLYIGMDHFAKPGDELAVAQAGKKLHRNFQGYSTKPDCDMLAFGISAIGKVGSRVRRERQDARRVLREARRRHAAGDAWRGALRRRPDPPRRHPEADVQFRAGFRRARRTVRHRVRRLLRAGPGVASPRSRPTGWSCSPSATSR